MTFEEVKQLIESSSLGFTVTCKRRSRSDVFYNLKPIASFNPGVCGFGVNHYDWTGLPKPYTNSIYFDGEGVNIPINRETFVSAQHEPGVLRIETQKEKIIAEYLLANKHPSASNASILFLSEE